MDSARVLSSGSQNEKEVQSHIKKSIDSSSDNNSLPHVCLFWFVWFVWFVFGAPLLLFSPLNALITKYDMLQITLKTWNKVYLVHTIFLLLEKNKMHSLQKPFAYISLGRQPCTTDKTDNTDTLILPHIASELADTYTYYLNELWLRTT